MAKVEFKDFIVSNIEPCPRCNSEVYFNRAEFMNLFKVGCRECYLETKSAVVLFNKYKGLTKEDSLKENARKLFKLWNDFVSESQGTKLKRIIIKKENFNEN